MQSLNFNEGYKEFCINNDETRVIRFNPSDIGILERVHEAEKAVKEALAENVSEETLEQLKIAKQALKEATNYIFNTDVYDTIFGNQNPISPVNGKFLFERMFEGLTKLMKPYIDEEQKKIDKKMTQYVKEAKAYDR